MKNLSYKLIYKSAMRASEADLSLCVNDSVATGENSGIEM